LAAHEGVVEVESGKKVDRSQLEKSFQLCRVLSAKLVIAKLDRLSRDAHFLLGLEKARIDFVAADMPQANRGLTLPQCSKRRCLPSRQQPQIAAGRRKALANLPSMARRSLLARALL
jgi:hypothetical protein